MLIAHGEVTQARPTRLSGLPICASMALVERPHGRNARARFASCLQYCMDRLSMRNSDKMNELTRIFAIAPMMEWTDRHCRFFHRLLTRRARIYTEMISAAAVLHGDRARLLAIDPAEHPVALQLGGSDPQQLAPCAQ